MPDEPTVKRRPSAASRQSCRPAAAWVAGSATSSRSRPGPADSDPIDGAGGVGPGQGGQIDQADRPVGLRREVEAKVRFRHGRHRMTAHHGMPVDPVHLPPEGREKVAVGRVALELRRPDHDRHDILLEHGRADLGGLADAADCRAGIEGRADLVVADRGVEIAQMLEDRPQVLLHPGRGFAAAGARDADGPRLGKARPLGRRRGRREKHGRHAARGQRFHHVGRAGQIVAVIGQEKLRGAWSIREALRPPRPTRRISRATARARDDRARRRRAECRPPRPPSSGGPPGPRRRVRPDG